MRAFLICLMMLFGAPASAQQTSALPQLCDVADTPKVGMEVQARGRLIFDLHGSALFDLERGCSIAVSWQSSSAAGLELNRLMFVSGPLAPADASVTGTLEWVDDQAPARGLPPGYWVLNIAGISDILISSRTQGEVDADQERLRKLRSVTRPH